MAKIVHRIINSTYIPLNSSLLNKGEIVPFDCFIKRFGNYLLIIEAGTLITNALYEKIQLNPIMYTLNMDSVKVQEYCTADSKTEMKNIPDTSNDVIFSSAGLNEQIHAIPAHERLNAVYTSTSALLQSIFDASHEELPQDALFACATQTVNSINDTMHKTSQLFAMIPEEYTAHHHSTNVAFYSAILGKAIYLSDEELIDVTYAGLMHDIGKIRIDKSILLKPGSLDPNEYEIMKTHPDKGWSILQQNGITNKKILDGVRFHHEKLDGSGYPLGLQRKMIPKFARIIGICDVFDALTTKRTFRDKYTTFEALILLKREMNRQFDEDLIDAFIRLLRKA